MGAQNQRGTTGLDPPVKPEGDKRGAGVTGEGLCGVTKGMFPDNVNRH